MARGERWIQGELFARETKRCSSCGESKSVTEFHRKRTARDGLQSTCRSCNIAQAKQFHADNAEHCRRRIAEWTRRVDRANKERALEYLLVHPCIDCGESDPLVLDFDHQRDKERGIAELLHGHVRWSAIEAEIEKCEVRCANCHRRRTAIAAGYYRALNQSDT